MNMYNQRSRGISQSFFNNAAKTGLQTCHSSWRDIPCQVSCMIRGLASPIYKKQREIAGTEVSEQTLGMLRNTLHVVSTWPMIVLGQGSHCGWTLDLQNSLKERSRAVQMYHMFHNDTKRSGHGLALKEFSGWLGHLSTSKNMMG